MKTLKIWNGRPHGKWDRSRSGKQHHIYVAAYSQKQCAELVSKACEYPVSVNEIAGYYSKNCWGNPMSGITPTEPCVYVSDESDGKYNEDQHWVCPVQRVI